MRCHIALACLILGASTTAALAQFPPPGIYRCSLADGTAIGTLSLLPAGDYQFSVAKDGSFARKPDDPGNGQGQLTSAGTAIALQSGPLATVYHWQGSFSTDAHKQHTSFKFSGPAGDVACK